MLLVGEPYVQLFAATSAVDTDWTARLCIVDEDGISVNLQEGIVRAQFRDSFEMSDPKVMWASFTWVAFAAALASRTGGAGAERRAAKVTIGAFTVIILAYVVIRIAAARGGVFL